MKTVRIFNYPGTAFTAIVLLDSSKDSLSKDSLRYVLVFSMVGLYVEHFSSIEGCWNRFKTICEKLK